MRNFLDLKIWQKSHSFTLKIYSSTKNYPKEEMFGLSSQMRRSASSIPSNIAEGCGRNTDSDFKRFLIIASGSSAELEYQLILSRDLNYFSEITFNELNTELIEIRKMIHSFIKKLPTKA
jgi:four helix bundle protein